MLHADQILLVGSGCLGDRLGETFLLSASLRWILRATVDVPGPTPACGHSADTTVLFAALLLLST